MSNAPVLTFVTLGALLLSGAAHAQGAPLSSSDVEVVSETATVIFVDQGTRTAKLKTSHGDVFDYVAGPEVRNFAQVKVSDVVTAAMERRLTFTVSPRGTQLPTVAAASGGAQAKPGEKPGVMAGAAVSMSGIIVAVDAAAKTVAVVENGGGPVHTLQVRNPERQALLGQVHAGDVLTVTYAETVGIAVTPAK